MPALLVSDQEIYDYLDLVAATDDVKGNVLRVRDGVEALLAHDTGREFGPGVVAVDEVYDGTGTHKIWTNRPIKTLAGIKFRFLPEIVQDSYTLDITSYVTFTVGKRRITSLAQRFPEGSDNVLISYESVADQPELAKQAVREATAMLYRARGSEDARSEQMGTFQHVMKRKLSEALFWQGAVDALYNPVLG